MNTPETQVPIEAVIAALQESPEGRVQLELATLRVLTRIQADELQRLRLQP